MFFYRLVPFLGMFSIYLVTSKFDTPYFALLNLFTGVAIIICLFLELAFHLLRLYVKYISTFEEWIINMNKFTFFQFYLLCLGLISIAFLSNALPIFLLSMSILIGYREIKYRKFENAKSDNEVSK